MDTLSQQRWVRSFSYLGGRWPIMSTRSLLFLVPISLIFMSGRGLEAISSNVDISATERPISVKFVLMTSVEGGVHVWVVHLSISLNIHNLKGLSHFVEN